MANDKGLMTNTPEGRRAYYANDYQKRVEARGEEYKAYKRQHKKDWHDINTPEGMTQNRYRAERQRAREHAKRYGIHLLTVLAERGLLTVKEQQDIRKLGL